MASSALFDQDFFNRLAHISISLRQRPLNGTGRHRSPRKGSSVEFSDVREYLPGDDIRRIDWNAYARSEKLFVKLYLDEREIRYHILIDTSRSMAVPKEKAFHTLRIAGMLAWLILNGGDRIDITFLKKERSYTTKSYIGTSSFFLLLKELETTEFSSQCDLASSIRSLPFSGSGTVFLLSDFLPPPEPLKTLFEVLAEKKQAAIFIQAASREEEEPEALFSEAYASQLFKLLDSETDASMKISLSAKLLKQYHADRTAFEQSLLSTALRYRAGFVKTVCDEPMEKFLEDSLRLGLLSSPGR